MREGIALTAFTERGRELASELAAALGGTLRENTQPLADWTEERFAACEALVFIGAAGIAVRSIAPHLQSKAADPAVICMDEAGRWIVPILSGHLGGGNALAGRLAALTGGEAVITTATDVNGRFAVDLWAKRQNMAVLQPERIKIVSAKILRGETITVDCPRPIAGAAPDLVRPGRDADVVVSYRVPAGGALQLVPRVLTLGVGCRRGTGADTLEAAFRQFCAERGIAPEAIERAATIDLKQDEEGLLRVPRLAAALLQCRRAAKRAGSIQRLGFCKERDRRRQCLRARGGHRSRREPDRKKIRPRRGDLRPGREAQRL